MWEATKTMQHEYQKHNFRIFLFATKKILKQHNFQPLFPTPAAWGPIWSLTI